MTLNLFAPAGTELREERLAPGAILLPGLAAPVEAELLAALREVVAGAPFRHMETPG